MIWDYFIYFALVAALLWIAGAYLAWRNRLTQSVIATSIGLVVFFAYILIMWVTLERPPMRTMGETRLWYSFFLPLIGHTKAMMPALQSPWFAPHVIVYMFAYALFGASTLMALYVLFKAHRHYKQVQNVSSSDAETASLNPENAETPCNRFDASVEFGIIDGMVCVGWAFLTIGMLFGSLWAKDAWGHYWAWDPKETWAAITWFAYLLYMHYRLIPTHNRKYSLYILVVGFLLLQMCWWGINYLPSAQGTRVRNTTQKPININNTLIYFLTPCLVIRQGVPCFCRVDSLQSTCRCDANRGEMQMQECEIR